MASTLTDRELKAPRITSTPRPTSPWQQAVSEAINGQHGPSNEIADFTTELNEQLDTRELIEDKISAVLNSPTADLIQDDLPTHALKPLLLRLHDERCQGTLSDGDYEITKTAAIARWLQGAPERTEQHSAPAVDDVNLTSELDACTDTQDLNADELPVGAQDPGFNLPPQNKSSAIPVAIDPFQPGNVICGRYVIEATIGHGGFAIVYRARDLQHSNAGQNPHVALKVLHPALRERPQAIARLKREFRQTQLLSHPSIVRVLDLDSHEGVWFMVMELLEGETLAQRLSRCGHPIAPLEEAYAALAAYADGLSFAHAHHIAHGDFKPSNLFLLHDGSVRIIDFGSSLDMCSSGVERDETNPAATPAYASPQVLARQAAEPRDDVFSFACVTFNVLVGRHPVAWPSSVAIPLWSDALLESAALSPHQLTVLKRGVAWRREDRPDSVHEFFQSLTTLEIADADLEAMAEPAPTDVALVTPIADPAPDARTAPSSNAQPELLPAAVSEPMQPLDTVANTEPATLAKPLAVAEPPSTAVAPTPSQVQVLTDSAPPPAAPTAQRRTGSASQSSAVLIPPFLPPPTRTPSYRWLLLLVPLWFGFLLFRSSDSELTAHTPVQSNSGAAGDVRTSPASSAAPTSEELAATQQERSTLSPTAADPAASLAPVPKKTRRTANPNAPAVTFDTPTMRVTERALVAAIILKRVNGHSGRLRVRWRLKAGSAAVGRDFSGPLSGVAEFADLQHVRVLFVPLLSDPQRHTDRTFVVELSSASNDVVIAPVQKVQVTIQPTN